MAIYHFSVQRISRGQGKSSIGASAYRAGEKLENERDGLTHDYTKRNDVVHSEIIAPDKSPEWVQSREKLWNQVESVEKRKDANTAREINVALPKELTIEQQKKLVREFIKDNFTSKNMIADVAIHDKGDGNPHTHIMLTTRAITSEGFENKKIADLDKKEKTIELWRESWAKYTNRELERADIRERVDHRSFVDQGIEKLPTRHEGHIVREMEQRGVQTELGTHNKRIMEENKKLELIDRQVKTYERSLENERTRSNGIENRGLRDERGTIRGQESTRDALGKILFERTSRGNEINSQRADSIVQSSKRANEKERELDDHTRAKTTGEREVESRDIGKGQQSIQGTTARNERLEGIQYAESRNHLQKPIGRDTQQREQAQGNYEATHGIGSSSQEYSQSIMEGKGETIRNTAINNNRFDSGNIGHSPVSEPFGEILKTLAKSIEKADRSEKEKEAKILEQERAKVRASSSRSKEIGRTQTRSRDMER